MLKLFFFVKVLLFSLSFQVKDNEIKIHSKADGSIQITVHLSCLYNRTKIFGDCVTCVRCHLIIQEHGLAINNFLLTVKHLAMYHRLMNKIVWSDTKKAICHGMCHFED